MSSVTQTVLGSVVSLWRYPVKSMMGEELNASEVTRRGLLGDRAYALVDSVDGKVASAKNPRKWPQLFDFRATFVESPQEGGKCSDNFARRQHRHHRKKGNKRNPLSRPQASGGICRS